MDNKKVAIIGDGGRIRLVNSPEGTDSLGLPEVESNYIVKSPGTPIHFADGVIVNINRAERRRRGLYGANVRRVKRTK